MPRRLRTHARLIARERTLRQLTVGPRDRMRRRLRGQRAASEPTLDLFVDANAAAAAGRPLQQIHWPRVAANEIIDEWSAARWCIDLLRTRADLRQRFPLALSSRRAGTFCAWLQRNGASTLGLHADGLAHVLAVFEDPPSDNARQAYLENDTIRENLPHGLTPVGAAALWRCFFTIAWDDREIRAEQIWWLFLEALEDPALEVARAYLFAPAWQQQRPDGLTVFGREAFAQWFGRAFGVQAPWLLASNCSERSPAMEIRTAYWARESWRRIHPRALTDVAEAERMIRWLASDETDISASARAWCRGLDAPSVARALTSPGVNVIGHFCYPSGLRVSAECVVEGLRQTGMQLSLRDTRVDKRDDPHHVKFDGLEIFDVTIVHIEPEPFFDLAYHRADVAERKQRTYRIGYWYWEFDTIPESWAKFGGDVDEVWVATEFVARAMRSRLSVPVHTLRPGVKLPPYQRRDRSHFGLSRDTYTFLFTFHMASTIERKNPLGLIRAFKLAFGADDSAALVLKTTFGARFADKLAELRHAAVGANIRIIDANYTYDEVLSLMDACDVYVSLHRSEGLGLTMAEAMLMAKPVIATRYSGNVDFMDDGNSLLVDYELQTLGRDSPPYEAGSICAMPSEKHAAELMRQLYEDRAGGHALGERARIDARSRLSLEAAGERMLRRLHEIGGRAPLCPSISKLLSNRRLLVM